MLEWSGCFLYCGRQLLCQLTEHLTNNNSSHSAIGLLQCRDGLPSNSASAGRSRRGRRWVMFDKPLLLPRGIGSRGLAGHGAGLVTWQDSLEPYRPFQNQPEDNSPRSTNCWARSALRSTNSEKLERIFRLSRTLDSMRRTMHQSWEEKEQFPRTVVFNFQKSGWGLQHVGSLGEDLHQIDTIKTCECCACGWTGQSLRNLHPLLPEWGDLPHLNDHHLLNPLGNHPHWALSLCLTHALWA